MLTGYGSAVPGIPSDGSPSGLTKYAVVSTTKLMYPRGFQLLPELGQIPGEDPVYCNTKNSSTAVRFLLVMVALPIPEMKMD